MDSKWVVVVIEQDCEEISVYDCQSEDDAHRKIREIWEHDLAVEAEESTRRVDFVKSACNDSYGELYYLGECTPIRYSVEEITSHKKNEKVSNIVIEIKGAVYRAGDVVPRLIYKQTETSATTEFANVKLIVINHTEGYIVIDTPDKGLVKILISEIQK